MVTYGGTEEMAEMAGTTTGSEEGFVTEGDERVAVDPHDVRVMTRVMSRVIACARHATLWTGHRVGGSGRHPPPTTRRHLKRVDAGG